MLHGTSRSRLACIIVHLSWRRRSRADLKNVYNARRIPSDEDPLHVQFYTCPAQELIQDPPTHFANPLPPSPMSKFDGFESSKAEQPAKAKALNRTESGTKKRTQL